MSQTKKIQYKETKENNFQKFTYDYNDGIIPV